MNNNFHSGERRMNANTSEKRRFAWPLAAGLAALVCAAPSVEAGALVLADSNADWSLTGTQGENGWTYGYYNRTADGDASYQAADLQPFLNDGSGVPETCPDVVPCAAALVEVNHWTGSAWDFEGNPPWTFLGRTESHPNGSNQAATHWTVRRWTSDFDGEVAIAYSIRKNNTSGTGVSARVFVGDTEVALETIAGNNTTGVTRTVFAAVVVGTTIDLAHDALGLNGDATDGSDASTLSMVISTVPDTDGDGLTDNRDNCIDDANAEQADGDGDGVGDVCDNCPETANSNQADRDRDGCGDACDMAVADSIDDWSASGTQGARGWFYGYYDRTADGDATYQTADFRPFLNDGSNVPDTCPAAVPCAGASVEVNHWTGSSWDFEGNPPWTFLAQQDVHPNSTGNGGEHWPIRRWVVPKTVVGTGYAQSFSVADGTTNLGDGSVVGSNDGTASVQGGALRLTQDGIAGTRASYRVPAIIGSSQGWSAEFDVTLADSVGANPPADGFSFTYGSIPAPGAGPAGGHGDAEEGFGGATPQLSYEFDTWMVGDAEHGFNVAVNQTDVPGGFVPFDILVDGQTASAHVVISWSPTTGASLSLDAGGGPIPVFTNLATPGFTANDAHSFAFSARTGGAHETVLIDDLLIESAEDDVTKIVDIAWHVRATNLGGSGTSGVLFVNGAEVDSAAISGNDGTGVIRGYFVEVGAGDVIDLALTPVGPTGDRADGSDGSANWMRIKMKVPCNATNAIGETGADSQADWSASGTQGENGWSYGYYDVRRDVTSGDGVYGAGDFVAFLNDGSGVVSADGTPGAWAASANHWNGTIWDLLSNGAPVNVGPWTELSRTGGHPAANGQARPEVHWAVRRWTSDVAGTVSVHGILNNGSAGGDGVIGRIFVDGIEVWSALSDGNSVNFDVWLDLAVGDRVDFAIDPDGAGALDVGNPATLDVIHDGSDGTNFTVTIDTLEFDVVFPCVGQLAGDCNQDGARDIADVICEVRLLFAGFFLLDQTPPTPPCDSDDGNAAVLDVNGDGRLNVSDVVRLAAYLFQGGAAPVQGLDCFEIPAATGCGNLCVSEG